MFTGIVQALGRVEKTSPTPGGRHFIFALAELQYHAFNPGDSIAVNGACLTAVDFPAGSFAADVSAETLRVTTLGTLTPGSPVNLEPAMTLANPVGGHLVTGHVDGVGEVAGLERDGGTLLLRVALPADLRRYVARKGSLCIDGVSLTVNEVVNGEALFTLVPHTLKQTILQGYGMGTRVNIEVDLIARYVERLLERP